MKCLGDATYGRFAPEILIDISDSGREVAGEAVSIDHAFADPTSVKREADRVITFSKSGYRYFVLLPKVNEAKALIVEFDARQVSGWGECSPVSEQPGKAAALYEPAEDLPMCGPSLGDRLTFNTPLRDILADPKGKIAFEKYFHEWVDDPKFNDPRYQDAKALSMNQIISNLKEQGATLNQMRIDFFAGAIACIK